MNEIFLEVRSVVSSFFKIPPDSITLQTVASDVDGWDSLSHIQLILKIEDHFQVRFSLGDLQNLKNFGSLVDLVTKKKQTTAQPN